MFQILDEHGSLVGEPPFDLDTARRLYAAMVAARAYDREATALQKQGRLGTYAPFEGQEAAQIGSAAALRPDDWMVATYRDAAAMWLHGYPWTNLILGRAGDERGGSPPAGIPVLPPSIIVGAHMLHAVGLGWAAQRLGEERVAITYFGDGATSEGDFHEAMNFAAVFATPTVFLCQNNGWAVSLPRHRQTVSETIAVKALAYGMPGEHIDGNDVMAVYAKTAEALARARSGGGPTLIEAVTYRLGPHTTGDDPGRYRADEEPQWWRDRDPLERLRRYLVSTGSWDEGWQQYLEAEAADAIEIAVAEAESQPPSPADEVFTGMFADPTSQLERQRIRLSQEMGEA